MSAQHTQEPVAWRDGETGFVGRLKGGPHWQPLYQTLPYDHNHDASARIAELEKQRDTLLAALLRVKEICLRECGIGIVNEVVIDSVKGGAA